MSSLNHAHLNGGAIRVSLTVPGRSAYAQSSATRAIIAAGLTSGVLDDRTEKMGFSRLAL